MTRKSNAPIFSMSAKEIIKRSIFLVVSLLVMAFGVAFSIKADLGTSPISSFPYVVSLLGSLTVGQVTIIMHCVLILLQIIILRKKYQFIQLLQLPVAFIFGFMTDAAIAVIDGINPANYLMRWVYCIIGLVILAVGVSMEVTSRITTLAGEGFALALCQVIPKKFSTLKICTDVSLVILAVIVSLIGMHTVKGVREGTLAAAIFVGLLTRKFNPMLEKFEEKALK
ncbi:MAG: DUF6198 family protein [Clostridiales bacterium]|nr:DUF6198 family protein [Clostridiales bacterium]